MGVGSLLGLAATAGAASLAYGVWETRQFTLREVARRAGVSHSAPYKHFPDKASLLSEMALLGFDRLREAVLKAKAQQSKSLRDEFFAVAQAYIRFGTTNPALYQLMFSGDFEKAADVHLNDRALAAFGVLTELLERGQAEGILRKRHVRGQATACWAQLHGMTMLSINGLRSRRTVVLFFAFLSAASAVTTALMPVLLHV